MTIAFVVGLSVFRYNLKKISPKSSILDFALIFSISGILGSRIMYIILYPYQFNTLHDYLAIYEGGMVFYGGLLASIVVSGIYIIVKKLNMMQIADAAAPGLAIGHSIGRLGCYSNGCCYGCKTNLIKIYHMAQDQQGVFRHPTQLYESLFLLILFIITEFFFIKLIKLKKKYAGLISSSYVACYSLFRFFIEYIRGDDRGGFFTSFHLSISQCVSIVMFLPSVVFIIYLVKKHSKRQVKLDE